MSEIFEKKNIIELQKMNLEDVKKYYTQLRNYNFENNIPLQGIKYRKIIHKLLLEAVKIDRILSKEKVKVISDSRIKSDRPIIYACTHIGGNDIQRTFEAIKEHAYLFLGDPEGLYKDLSGLALYLNGVICLETRDKRDRYIAKERAIELLKQGSNLLIYPEGAWNITENLPVMDLYNGTIKMALETGADIVPVAIEQYEDEFLVNIGKNISISSENNIKESNENLRDILATLKWQIWELMGTYKRKDISEEEIKMFKQNIIDKCEYGFTIEDVYETMYKDPNKVSPDEVFSYKKKRI